MRYAKLRQLMDEEYRSQTLVQVISTHQEVTIHIDSPGLLECLNRNVLYGSLKANDLVGRAGIVVQNIGVAHLLDYLSIHSPDLVVRDEVGPECFRLDA